MEDMFHAYILGMDTFALGLLKAAAIIEDGRIDDFIKNKYASFNDTEIGKKILSGNATLSELADYAINLGIKNAYIQEKETADLSFIPEFYTE